MSTTPRPRGRPPGVPSQHVMIRMPNDLLAQIDAYAETLEAQIGLSDVSISRALAIRELCKKGLQSLASAPPAPQPTTQPAIPLALEPAPKTAPLVAMPQAAAKRPGRPSTLRQPIIDLLREHPEGLTATQMRVYLGVDKKIGDTLQGMVRDHVIEKQGSGSMVCYLTVPAPGR